MSKLITSGNMAIFEYPTGAINPQFQFDEKGILFIFGYPFTMMGKTVDSARRFETGLIGYKFCGKHGDNIIIGDYRHILADVNPDHCVVFMRLAQ